MLSIDQLATMFHSLTVDSSNSNDSCLNYEDKYNEGYEDGYNEGYNEGYMAGYKEAMNSMTKSSVPLTLLPNVKHATKPPFGWQIFNNQLIPNKEEQIIIEAIKCILKDYPGISLTDISRILTGYRFKIRKSARIYPSTIRNIINANNLQISSNKCS
jgi:hypothetical protein